MAEVKRKQEDLLYRQFYAYTVAVSSLASGGTDTKNININSNASFQLMKMTCMADIAAAAQTDSSRVIPLVTLQINDANSGNNMFSVATPIPNIFGTGQIPFLLNEPKTFEANSTIQLTFANYDAASTYNLYLSFIGYHLYYRG